MLATLLHVAVANTAAVPFDRPLVRVAVRPEGRMAADPRMVADIVRTAGDIWRPYADIAFDVTDRDLRPAGSLQVVITDRTSAVSDPASLGWIAFVDGRPTDVITVSAAAASALMKASRWGALPPLVQRTFLVRAIGRAIAHELGHYLLASPGHAVRGLMRGQLTADDIMEPRKSSVRLERADVRRLGQGVLVARHNDARHEIENEN